MSIPDPANPPQSAEDLIRRHIHFVRAAALRRVGGDEHLADDVTQAVFILLLRKGHRINSEVGMTSWLYTTTRYAAANAVKMRRRREFHERRATPLDVDRSQSDSPQSAELGLLVYQAIDKLPKADRLCVVMNFLQEKTHAQVGAAVGMSAEAARKRTGRALERVRELLAVRGAIFPVTEVAASLAVGKSAASAQLIQSTLNIAILSQPAPATAAGIAKAVTHMLFALKLKVAAVLLIAFLMAGLVTAQAVRELGNSGPAPVATSPATAPSTAVRASDTADLGNGESVQFVGVSPYDHDEWHDINGQRIDTPPGANSTSLIISPPPKYKALLRITCPQDVDIAVGIARGSASGTSNLAGEHLIVFDANPGTTVDLTASIADGPWNNAMQFAANPGHVMSLGEALAEVSCSPFIDQNGKSLIYVSIAGVDYPRRVVCIGMDGGERLSQQQASCSSSHTNIGGYLFDLPANQIREIAIQHRSYNHHVTAKNVCLDFNNAIPAQIIVDH